MPQEAIKLDRRSNGPDIGVEPATNASPMIARQNKRSISHVFGTRVVPALIVAALALVAMPALRTSAAAQEGPSQSHSRALARADRHMVSAANEHAAEAGREMLRAGGSAIDAAIATQLVLNLVEPQ